MGRPRKYGAPTATITARLAAPLAAWVTEASWSLRKPKTDLIVEAVELLMAIKAMGRRPPDHEYMADVSPIIHEAQAGTRVRAALASIRSAGPLTPEAQRVVDAVEAALQ